jgi:uncharacterized protein
LLKHSLGLYYNTTNSLGVVAMHFFPYQLAWYIAGPLIGLTVAGMFAVTNQPLGASGTYAQLSDKVLSRPVKEPWRLWFMLGVILGAAVYGALSNGDSWTWAYGELGKVLSRPVLLVVLLSGGLLMGVGARWAGGCTSGHGLCGTASRSPASFAATGAFFVTAVVVTQLVHLLTGGAL